MELILDIVYIYIGIFSVYFFILGIRSLNDRKFSRINRYIDTIEKSKICVVLYSHNNSEALKNILELIYKQNYPQEKIYIQILLDNCNDHSEEIFKEFFNIHVMNFNDGVTIGKDQAISILLESLRQEKSIESYVFIDINRYIEDDFLGKVNVALSLSPVVSGQTIALEKNNLSLSERIKICYNKYQNNFIRKARSLMGLSDAIDDSLLCIRKDFIEKVDALDLKDVNTELKYSILVSSLGYPCVYMPYIKTYVKAYDYEMKRPSLSYRIKLFRQCLTKIFTFRIKFIEHIFSLIAPNALLAIILSMFYMYLSMKFYFLFNFIVVFTVFSLLLLGFALSLLKSELYAKDFLYLALYPAYSAYSIVTKLPPCRFVKKHFLSSENKKDIKKYSVKIIATNGKANVPCRLDFISEKGMAKVVFSFKKKKFTSSRQIRMVDALNELILKLNDYGFSIKICYCCEYFSSIIDGSTNMVRGECNYQFKDRDDKETLETLIWNSCSACKVNKIRDI